MNLKHSVPSTRREKEIWEACDALWSKDRAHEKITGEAIREMLVKLGYKKGSPNEIYKYRHTWKQMHGFESDDVVSYGKTDPIARAVALVREEIQHEAEAKIYEVETYAKESVDKYATENQIFKASLEDVKQLNNELNTRLKDLEHEMSTLKSLYEHTKEEFQETHARAETLEKDFGSYRTDTQQFVQTLKSELERYRTQLSSQSNEQKEYYLSQIQSLKQQIDKNNEQHIKEMQELRQDNQKYKVLFETEKAGAQTLREQEDKSSRIYHILLDFKQITQKNTKSFQDTIKLFEAELSKITYLQKDQQRVLDALGKELLGHTKQSNEMLTLLNQLHKNRLYEQAAVTT